MRIAVIVSRQEIKTVSNRMSQYILHGRKSWKQRKEKD